jgi:hypothetical protein
VRSLADNPSTLADVPIFLGPLPIARAVCALRASLAARRAQTPAVDAFVCWTDAVYPGPEVLQEVGRVTIAGSRLDIQIGMLWHHLDRTIDINDARRAYGAEQCRRVRNLARSRLTGEMQDQVLAAVDMADAARKKRNEIVHQDWLLRGPDAMRPVADLARVDPADLPRLTEDS